MIVTVVANGTYFMPDKPEVVGSSPTLALAPCSSVGRAQFSPVIKQPPLLVMDSGRNKITSPTILLPSKERKWIYFIKDICLTSIS